METKERNNFKEFDHIWQVKKHGIKKILSIIFWVGKEEKYLKLSRLLY